MSVIIHGDSRVATFDWTPAPYAPWMDDAACTGANPDTMYPVRGADVAPAKRLCRVCPVQAECLQYALDNNERWGIWGGLSTDERNQLRKQRRRS